jgi:hypothetical protein
MHFIVTTEGRDSLGLRQLLEVFANGQWVPDHYTPEQAAEFVLDQFKRTVASELELLVVNCTEASA